jgi:hypothetical protein
MQMKPKDLYMATISKVGVSVSLSGVILLTSLIPLSNANAKFVNQPPRSQGVNSLPTCGEAKTNGRVLTCMGSQFMMFAGGLQIVRYGASAVFGGETHNEMSAMATAYDLYCAIDLMDSYSNKIGTVEDVYNDSKTVNGSFSSGEFIKQGWDKYTGHTTTTYSDVEESKGFGEWKKEFIPKFTAYYVNKTPLAVFKGAAKGFAQEKLKDGGGPVEPDAVINGFLASVCDKKVQAGLMKVISGKKKSGLALITDSSLWDTTVDGEAKIKSRKLFADAAYTASDKGISAFEGMFNDMTSDIRDEMGQYGNAEKIKVKKMLGMVKSLVGIGDPNNQRQTFAGLDMNAPAKGGYSGQSPVIKQFAGKLDKVINEGKFFNSQSAVGQYTQKLQFFRDLITQTNNTEITHKETSYGGTYENPKRLIDKVKETAKKAKVIVDVAKEKVVDEHIVEAEDNLSILDQLRNLKPKKE